jgi:hypothetical protein
MVLGVVHGHTVVGEQGVQEGTKHTPMWGPCIKGQRDGGDVSYRHHLGLARHEVQDPEEYITHLDNLALILKFLEAPFKWEDKHTSILQSTCNSCISTM